jgi:hypothetical protein
LRPRLLRVARLLSVRVSRRRLVFQVVNEHVRAVFVVSRDDFGVLQGVLSQRRERLLADSRDN